MTCWTRPFVTYKVAWDGDPNAYVVWYTNSAGTQSAQGLASMLISFDYPSARSVSIYVKVGGVQSPSLGITVNDNGAGCTG